MAPLAFSCRASVNPASPPPAMKTSTCIVAIRYRWLRVLSRSVLRHTTRIAPTGGEGAALGNRPAPATGRLSTLAFLRVMLSAQAVDARSIQTLKLGAHHVLGDGLAELLAHIAGGSEMYAGEDAGVLDLLER